MRTLTMDLPEDWVRYPVDGFHLVATAPVTQSAEHLLTDGLQPGGSGLEPELAPNIVATTYAGEPAGLCGLDRLYVVEDVTCTVGGYPARRMDLTRWTGRNNIFTRRWLVQEALAEGRATLEISASCLISDYEYFTAVFDAAIASARFTPDEVPAESAPLRAVA
ncbi:hypothetical protein GCM10010977_17870 [Citricoccus zhacaiensis]|uniref:SRPBCC family protein n=1 Tax=Citricoccus zhacaiensis TaxID=489142 RepID=A0ABQ2M0F8_9MICC|nr:hypothetical protein [Citricoccus zhacaiensis]GGO45341.1 hypothetical protein GCM10010977_17870 [Citricoccus zhacaiensis]